MKYRSAIIAGVVFFILVVGFLLLPQRVHMRIQSGFLGAVAPFLKQGSSWEKSYTIWKEGYKRLSELETEVKQLRVDNKELKATNQTLRGFEGENQRLRKALGYRESIPFKLCSARVVARDSSSWYNRVTIDRGSDDGIGPDMCVLTEEGLVGKTERVISAHATQIILISDENCKVSAIVENTTERGIVRGERTSSVGNPRLVMGMLSKTAVLPPQSAVYTAGLTTVYPKGVLIGYIEDFKPRELDAVSTIRPAVLLSELEDVFVVIKQ